MASAKKLPSGRWRVLVYDRKDPKTGKRKYKSFTGDTKREAEMLAAQYAYTHKPSVGPQMTVRGAVARYIGSKSNVLSPSTVAGYEALHRRYFDELDELDLSELTNEVVQRWVNELALSRSPKTVKNAYGLLSATMAVYAPETHLRIDLPQKRKTSISIPSSEDFAALLADVAGTDMEIPVLLAGCTGLRRSEISALTPEDVDVVHCTIHVRSAVVLDRERQFVKKAPKSYAGDRVLEIPEFVMERLAARIRQGLPPTELTPDQITDRFRFIRRRLGVSYTFHGLRHYYASVMLSLGVPNRYAAERMGHSTDYMLQRVYQHTMDDQKKAVSDRVNTYFNTNATQCNTPKR